MNSDTGAARRFAKLAETFEAADITLVKRTVLVIGILAAIALVAADVMAARDRRRPPHGGREAAGRAAARRVCLTLLARPGATPAGPASAGP